MGNEIKDEVQRMIEAVGLTEKKNTASKQLSGGQKRKLSVSIAFIGGSRVVFLDEPTSGMDPYSRRFTWNIIRQHREGRVVVLTTHFMDEADLLGDRIAIMGDGKLICCGSSLYLKNQYGVGYSLTLEKKDAISFDSQAVTKVICDRVNAILLTDVGTEMTWQLPFAASEAFPSLFQYFDDNLDKLGLESYGISVTTLEEVFIKITRSTHTGKRADQGKKKGDSISPKAISASVELTERHPANEAEVPIGTDESAVFVAPSGKTDSRDGTPEKAIDEASALPLEEGKSLLSSKSPMQDFEKINEDDQITYFFVHMRALLEKRALYFLRDKKAWIFTYIIPFAFLLAGLLIMKYTYPTSYEPLLEIRSSLYNAGITNDFMPMPYTNAKKNRVDFDEPTLAYAPDDFHKNYRHRFSRSDGDIAAAQLILNKISDKDNYPLIDADANYKSYEEESIRHISLTAQADKGDYAAMMIGGFCMVGNDASKDTKSIISTNYSATFAVPLIQQILGSATVKKINSEHSIKTSYFLLPETRRQDEEFNNYNVDLVVTFMLLAIPFVPASFITYIVREKEVKAKHQQMVSGVGVVAYWLSNFIWDNLSYSITVFLLVVLVTGPVFGDDTNQLGGGGADYSDELGAFFGMLFLFGSSMTGATYLLSYIFKQPSMAQICTIFVVFITGLVLGIVGIVLRIIPDTRDEYKDYIQYLLCLFPPFALADGLHNMALITVWSNIEKGGKAYKVSDWRITGLHMMMMGWETFVYLGAVILIDLIGSQPQTKRLMECRTGSLPAVDETLKDEDVTEQEQEVASGAVNPDNSVILVEGLKKMYRGGKFAVRGVSLGIPNCECFGLLGINGAGKSSTLSMLSGEFAPSGGHAWLAGMDIFTDIHQCRRKIGYCPQFDALFELLTAREHLQLYARIKGIVEKDIDRVVSAKIEEMGLTEYADRYAGTYSGGNKRKLSVAIAMIGEPSIVFLDEPSTGMDPVARRFMWDVISDIVTKRESCSLILTTHSMEECEALCTRIGIMVGGVMRCLGSAQRLRTKYGKGYQTEIGVELPTHDDIVKVSKELTASLGKGEMNEEQLHDAMVTDAEIKACFNSLKKEQWIERLTATGSGSDLVNACSSTGGASLKHFASWYILEGYFDEILEFLTANFTTFVVHERQPTKLRIEVPSELPTGGKRLLSSMFKAIEGSKAQLHIKDYSMAQTSLEQIFNFFAQQQEEEQGSAGALGASA